MSEAYVPTQQPQASEEARLPQADVHPCGPRRPEGPEAQGPGSAVRLIWRVERRELFIALRAARRGRSGPLTVAHLPGDASDPPRVAFAVGRHVGGAVVRNRVRRRLRAHLASRSLALPAGTYLISAGPSAATSGFEDLGRDLTVAVRRAQPPTGTDHR